MSDTVHDTTIDTVGICLILSGPTGVTYSNQTGGYACHHPRIEGFIVPFLSDNISEPPHVGCWGPIEARDVPAIASWISSEIPWLRLDDTRLSEAEEGWWPVVVIRHDANIRLSDDMDLVGKRGILTTENCD